VGFAESGIPSGARSSKPGPHDVPLLSLQRKEQREGARVIVHCGKRG
jgi:hypothetical protein